MFGLVEVFRENDEVYVGSEKGEEEEDKGKGVATKIAVEKEGVDFKSDLK